ncbi:F0F1 ATP synthase subunit B [Lacticaseibacillus parakribbianus]|uniref:F0F1 ATP synthase subunit B n=1 Tax=Lacticaseibacillus parakribbianus TaxID=2970927 RepID=UPI0021CB2B1E|nr:F0F1 ATP synthase subunit B [Lacticaseibacillus parakribbianus]
MTAGDMLFTIVTFAVLLVLVGLVAWKPVTAIMLARQEKIEGDLDYADNARKEAKELAEKRQAELKNSKADAVKIVNTAKENGEKQRQELVSAAKSEADTLKLNAHKDIAQERQDALNNAKNDVADLSLAIAKKIIGKELDADTQSELIDSYIKDLGDANGSH